MVRGLDRGYPPGAELKGIFREAPAAHWKENSEESGDLGWPSPRLAAVQGILSAWRPSVLLYGLEARRACHQLFAGSQYSESGKTGVLQPPGSASLPRTQRALWNVSGIPDLAP